jgi:hypothetical protein
MTLPLTNPLAAEDPFKYYSLTYALFSITVFSYQNLVRISYQSFVCTSHFTLLIGPVLECRFSYKLKHQNSYIAYIGYIRLSPGICYVLLT